MKKIVMLSVIAFSLSLNHALQAGVIVLGGPSAAFTPQQPITAVVTDSNGNSSEQTVYYNPTYGGVDIGNPGPYVSVYFPTLSTGYLWNNGFWVGEDGYYWNNGARVYVGPQWHDHWHNYWGQGWHGGYHGGGYHDGYHGGGWGHENGHGHENSWHGHEGHRR